MRKVIQLTVGPDDIHPFIALCDDGTGWVFHEPSLKWRLIKAIPQKEIPQ